MNIVLLREVDRLEGDRFVITDGRAAHVEEVLNKATDDRVRVGLADGPLGTATIVEHAPSRFVLDVAFDPEVPPRPDVNLIVAVPRPKSLRRLLRDATTMGVNRIVLIRTWRVDKAYLQSPLLTPDGYGPLLDEGLMQARDTHRPLVTVEPLFKPFVEDRAPAMSAESRAIVLHPDRAAPHLATFVFRDRTATVAIGPEGGFSAYEVEAFEAAGFVVGQMGSRILRVETACTAALATIAAARQRRATD